VPIAEALAIAIGLVALAIPPSAHAASSRAEYVAQVEPICQAAQKPTFKAYTRTFKEIPTVADKGIKASDVASRNVSGFGFHFCTFSIGDAEL
jgi:hypothetical protein